MKLNVFISTQRDGIMSNDKKFFPNLSKEERELLYKTTLTRFFEKTNIKYENVVVLKEENKEIKARTATNSIKKLKEAILLLKDNKNLCVALETSDAPAIIATATGEDNKSVSAIAIGTIENINNNILHNIIKLPL